MRNKFIEVVDYDNSWPERFLEMKLELESVLGGLCLEVHHVGSTAVPGLCAKPKIDLIAVVRDLEKTNKKLLEKGYKGKGELNIPFRLFFQKCEEEVTYNIHVMEEGHPEIDLNIRFRDYLRQNPDASADYAQLKRDLVAKGSSHQKEHKRFSGYNLGKDRFIKKILQNSGFDGLCVRLCFHNEEREVAEKLRLKYFFDKNLEPISPDFENDCYRHLVLYRGVHMIGYCEIALLVRQQAEVRCFIVEDSARSQEAEVYFNAICVRWLQSQGFTKFPEQP